MQRIEVQDASSTLPALVAQVEAGDEIVLTRAGKPIARIVPEMNGGEHPSELTPNQQARARAAMERIRARAERLQLGPFDLEEFKRDRDEGRP